MDGIGARGLVMVVSALTVTSGWAAAGMMSERAKTARKPPVGEWETFSAVSASDFSWNCLGGHGVLTHLVEGLPLAVPEPPHRDGWG